MQMEQEEQQRGRRAADSRAEFVQILRMENVNGAGRLFGGHLMLWMDEVSAVSARRYARSAVTTACVEDLRFLRPAHQNDTVVVTGQVVYTGRTSMEVLVTAEVEALSGERTLIADAHVILVALDEDEHPRPVPPLLLETERERTLFAEAEERRKRRAATADS